MYKESRNKEYSDRFMGFASKYESTRPALPIHAIELIQNYLDYSIDTVVDLGCGTGLSTLVWQGYASKIVGIEPSIDMLEIAKKKENSKVHFVSGSGEGIPLEDESVDVVICSQSFHWMEPVSTLEEVNRILKPGGVFAAIDYDWPGVMNYPTELAIRDIRSYVRKINNQNSKQTNGYPKSKHIENMNNSNYFEYTREIVFSNQEVYPVEKLIAMIGSISGFQHCLKSVPDLFIPAFNEFADQVEKANDTDIEIEFGYRMRLGVKKQ